MFLESYDVQHYSSNNNHLQAVISTLTVGVTLSKGERVLIVSATCVNMACVALIIANQNK